MPIMITAILRQRRILLVPDDDLYLAFRLPPLIKKAGCEVDLLTVAGNPMVHSRYLGTVKEEPDHEALFIRLQKLLRDPQRPWAAVIVTHEKTMRRLVAAGDADLLKDWQPGALDPEAREFLLSKFGLATAAGKPQLCVPPGRICETMAEIQEFGRATGWPIIVKPPDGSGGRGVAKYNSPAELAANGQTVSLPILAQKYIQGQRGVVDMVCAAGRPLAWLASYSTKRYQGEFTPSTARLFRPLPELQPMVEALAQFTRFEGFCGFDWIEEAGTGRYYLIEFHPRPPSGFRFGHFCGVDFSAAVKAWLSGEAQTFSVQVQPPGRSVAAHYFSGDLLRCLRQRDWPGLRHWLPGSRACHDIYWDDLPLFAAWVIHRSRGWIRGKASRPERNSSREPLAKEAALG